jgi:hypothetical protein
VFVLYVFYGCLFDQACSSLRLVCSAVIVLHDAMISRLHVSSNDSSSVCLSVCLSVLFLKDPCSLLWVCFSLLLSLFYLYSDIPFNLTSLVESKWSFGIRDGRVGSWVIWVRIAIRTHKTRHNTPGAPLSFGMGAIYLSG